MVACRGACVTFIDTGLILFMSHSRLRLVVVIRPTQENEVSRIMKISAIARLAPSRLRYQSLEKGFPAKS